MASSPYPQSDRELLARIARSAGGKAGYKQLVRELGLGGGRERRLLLEQLSRMAARGDLRKLENELWAVPRPPAEGTATGSRSDRPVAGSGHGERRGLWTGLEESSRSGQDRLLSGRLEIHRDGYGFVRPDAKAGSGSGQAALNGDIFVPPTGLHGAMHGDLVLIEEDAPARDGRRSGRIARVLTRRNPTIVGIFHYDRPAGRRHRGSYREDGYAAANLLRGNFVQPLDERLGGPIEIPEGAEVIAGTLDSPHRTLGTEAVRAAKLPVLRPSALESRDEFANPDAEPRPEERSLFIEGSEASTSEAAPDSRWPLEGLAVEVEITSFPQPGRPARGRVLEVLGSPDAFGVDVEIVIRKHAIPHTFPAHVLAEAEERAQESVTSVPGQELALREDFRDLPIVTIDGETARDFDDAVLVRDLPNGNSELQVHIADVGWYVRSGSALDTEARVRGTSVYFPDRAVPMLPHALSSGMCSLLPHEDRLVLSCIMEIDARGEIVGYRVGEGLIRSARRMTYTSVQHCLNASPAAADWNVGPAPAISKHASDSPESPQTSSAIAEKSLKVQVTPEPSAEDSLERERITLEQPDLPAAFDRMLALALRLNRKRVRRGSIDFDLPEPVVAFDPDGNMKAIVRSERGWAHRLIEEFMLSANECVATWLTAQGIPSIYRIHEMPDPKRIVEFEETAAGFGQTLGIGTLPVKRLTMKADRREVQRRSAKGRGAAPAQTREIPENIPVTPQMYQRLVRRIQGTPEERILAYLMLRSLKQARYAEKNEGHFALASPCYTHFTSPIRRYPDLIVHRLLRTMLRRGANPVGGALLSTDPQPWAAELARSQGRNAAGGYPPKSGPGVLQPRAHTARDSAPAALVSPAKAKRLEKRAGRVGWSGTATDAFRSFEGESSTGQPEWHREDAEGDLVTAEPTGADATETRNSVQSAVGEPISAEELADIGVESSQAERRAADAERELIEWKKMKFMADKIGDDFKGIILSVTKYGFFVELDEMFIEGLVPIGSLAGDFYAFRDTDRSICGTRTGHCFRAGDRVEVILDRIDRQQRRLQFALNPGTEPKVQAGAGSLRAGKSEAKKARAEAKRQAKTAAKPKKSKSKRKK
ncbi:MAG: ribonuclease R family protein [Janthinobacterium lividum]